MNKVQTVVLCLLCFSLLSIRSSAQTVLSIDEVLSSVKENNYDLKAARQNIVASEVLTSKYNRGYLPTLGVTAGLGYNLSGVKSVFNFNFPDINIQNIQSYNGNVGVASSYLLYDGGQRKLRNEKNLNSLDYAHLQLENINQILSFNASQVYYSIAQAMLNIDLLKETLDISKERSKRAKSYYDYGKVNRVDVSNAKVDVVRDSLNLIRLNNDIENLKWQLNQLTLRKDTNYDVDTSFNLMYQFLNLDELHATMLASNKELITVRKNLDIIDYDLAIANKINAPQLSASGAYNVNYQKNSSNSQQDYSRNNGLNLGLNANWNILDGGQRKVQEQLAVVEQSIADITVLTLENDLTTQLNRLWNSYQNTLLTLRVEKQNIQTNKENFDLVKTLYDNGQQSSVEFRQAQLNLLNAQSQYYNARTEAKLLEVEMDFLLGK